MIPRVSILGLPSTSLVLAVLTQLMVPAASRTGQLGAGLPRMAPAARACLWSLWALLLQHVSPGSLSWGLASFRERVDPDSKQAQGKSHFCHVHVVKASGRASADSRGRGNSVPSG